jgi:heme exporter protein A
VAEHGTYSFRCDSLGHRFGRRRLFADISFELTQPGSVCIAGPNGSGKSTFLKIIVGLLRPARGKTSLLLDGRELSASAARQHLGLVAPDLFLYGELTAAENLTFFARLRRLQNPNRDWNDTLAFVGLEGRAKERVGNFSSGQRQRMKYLVATLHNPPLLLLDEPTANLDDAGRAIVSNIVNEQRQRRILIVATNDREEYAFGDRVVSLVE